MTTATSGLLSPIPVFGTVPGLGPDWVAAELAVVTAKLAVTPPGAFHGSLVTRLGWLTAGAPGMASGGGAS